MTNGIPDAIPNPVPEYCNFVTDVLDVWAEEPEKAALVLDPSENHGAERISFAEVRDRSLQIAGALRNAGLKPGESVAIVMGRRPQWWYSMMGMIRAGVVAIPGASLLTAKDLKFRIQNANIRGVIVDDPGVEKVDAIREDFPDLKIFWVAGEKRDGWETFDEIFAKQYKFEPTPTRSEDNMLVYFTSGTTGQPKMVQHTYASYFYGHYTTGKRWLALRDDDVIWNISDTGWAKAAFSSLFGPWIQGAAIFVQSEPTFRPKSILQTLRENPITAFCAPPTAYRQFIALDPELMKLPHLRRCYGAGEPLNAEIQTVWKKNTGLLIREAYGQSETTVVISSYDEIVVKPGSIGIVAPGYDIDLLDENLQPVPDGQEGEIAIRVKPEWPIGLFRGYKDNPEENESKFRGDYYLTGDLAVRDSDGYYSFVGRADDVINSSGFRIGPFEVESALLEHPAVLEAAVVGAPDPKRYRIVKAFVILRPGHEPNQSLVRDIQNFVRNTTAPYKVPREIEFIEALPKTVSGKIRRVELRERESWSEDRV